MTGSAPAPNAPARLEADRIARSYDRGRIHALRGASLSVAPEEAVAVIGPSGSGKSTLLHLLAGLDTPTEGQVRIDGRRPAGLRAWRRLRAHRIGFVFQAYHLLPALTALENVQVPMMGVEHDARRRRVRATELLEGVGLGGRGSHRPSELSGGERQRVAIARALANAPDMILADEPTGNLDTTASEAILALLGEVRRERRATLVLVTHDRDVAAGVDRILRLVDGRVVGEEEGP